MSQNSKYSRAYHNTQLAAEVGKSSLNFKLGIPNLTNASSMNMQLKYVSSVYLSLQFPR